MLSPKNMIRHRIGILATPRERGDEIKSITPRFQILCKTLHIILMTPVFSYIACSYNFNLAAPVKFSAMMTHEATIQQTIVFKHAKACKCITFGHLPYSEHIFKNFLQPMVMDHSKTHPGCGVALDMMHFHKKCTSSIIKAALVTAPAKSELAHSLVSTVLVQSEIFVINWVTIVDPILTNCTNVIGSARVLGGALVVRHRSYTPQLATFWNLGIDHISFSGRAFVAHSETGPLVVFAKLVRWWGIQESHRWACTLSQYTKA
jgi:hypothetical protein